MTVYVDSYLDQMVPAKWRGGGHMLGTDLDELHAMAKHIGLQRRWFQGRQSFAHYDLTRTKKVRALEAGAVEIEWGDIPDDVLMRRTDGTYERRCDRIARRRAEKEPR
jgi:hypothetical protein